MCEYCNDNKTIFEKSILDTWLLDWNFDGITEKNATYSDYILFVDSGFLRFADKDDCECLDHGKAIKIKFCPFCGKEL